jgi:hypothetical protein
MFSHYFKTDEVTHGRLSKDYRERVTSLSRLSSASLMVGTPIVQLSKEGGRIGVK